MTMMRKFWAEKRSLSFSTADDASKSGTVYKYLYFSTREVGKPVICLGFAKGNRKSNG